MTHLKDYLSLWTTSQSEQVLSVSPFVCACVRACMRACMCVCVHACVCVLLNHMSESSHHRLAKPKIVLKYATWALNKNQAMAVKVSKRLGRSSLTVA